MIIMERGVILKLSIDEIGKAAMQMRKDCLYMAEAAGSSGMHFGGTLSSIEIIASLYLGVMNIGKNIIREETRDRFILSKGHGVPALYAVLKQIGIFTEEDLKTFKQDDTCLFGHPSMNEEKGIEFSSGSLGQGLSLAVGTAIGLKHKKNYESKIFVLLGDGECNEGSVWEAAAAASHFRLGNIVAIIDRNRLQYDGMTQEILEMEPLKEKWESFGWDVLTINGHDIEECCLAFSSEHEKPLAVIADTIKGKGISFMENIPAWHHGKMTKKQQEQAWEEVGIC